MKKGYTLFASLNLAVISPWFDLVRNVKAKYRILDEDTYNFDETGF
jgi:hypothetical protein